MRLTPSLCSLIEELELYLPTYGQRQSQTQKMEEELTNFLSSLPDLHKLVLKGNSRVCQVFLNIPHPITPRLRYLHFQLTYSPPSRFATLPTSFLDCLTSYPSLIHLGLVRLAPRPRASALENPNPVRFPSLTSLEIGGSIDNYKAYRNLLRRCSPTALEIAEDADLGEWNPYSVPKLLSAILDPQLVKKFVLDSAHAPSSPRANFYLALSTLVNLEELTLSQQASSWDDEFYKFSPNYLSTSSSSAWTPWFPVVVLESSFFSVDVTRRLQVLELNHVSAARGNESDPYSDSWALPEWSDYFEPWDGGELVELGQKLGIQVRGTAIEAAQIVDEHRELLKRWQEENLDGGSETSDAEEVLSVDREVEGMANDEQGESEVAREGTPEREESDGHSEGYYYRTP